MTRKSRTVFVVNAQVGEVEETVNDAVLTANVYQAVTENLAAASIRYDKLEGRPHMVVPMVMITEGVHNGSNGPLYYPREELEKTPASWDHKPIVVYHPTMNGKSISACTPVVLNKRKIGVILNSKFEGGTKGQPGKLKAEAWLEVNRLQKVDKTVLNALKKGLMVEVSTGLFTDNENKEGVWNKEKYSVIARNYRPDHLAVLPDEVGACSIKDGAGLLRNSEMSYEDIRSQLQEYVQPKSNKDGAGNWIPSPWVTDVFDTFFIYSSGKKTMKQGYTKSEDTGKVSLNGVAVEVRRKTTYMSLDGAVINTGETKMTKKQLVNALIANSVTKWEETDRDTLMEFEPDVLERMIPEAAVATNKTGDDYAAGDAGEAQAGDASGNIPGKKKKPVANAFPPAKKKKGAVDDEEKDDEEDDDTTDNSAAAAPLTAEQYVANAPEGVREVLEMGMTTLNAKRDGLVAKIVANSRNTFQPAYLKTLPVSHLQAMADLAGSNTPAPQNNFLGRGDVFTAPTENQGPKVKPLPIPTMNFKKRD